MVRLNLLIALFFVLAATALAQDAATKKLDDAKATYQAAVEKNHKAVGAWFDKREETARKDGNKKLVDQIKAERTKYEEAHGDLPKTAPAELTRNLVDAQNTMEAAYVAAIKDYTRDKKDDLAAAAEKQLETFRKGRSRLSVIDLKLTSEAVTAKFAASKVAYDEQTGVLKLAYKFADRKELKDFVLSDTEPKMRVNAVFLSAGQNLKHIVSFDTVTVTGIMSLREMKGVCLSTTGGTKIGLGGDGKDTLYVVPKGRKALDKIVAGPLRQGEIRFGLTVTEKRATLNWANEELGGESAEPGAGQVIFHSGESGYAFGGITIAGKLNRDWAKEFFDVTEK